MGSMCSASHGAIPRPRTSHPNLLCSLALLPDDHEMNSDSQVPARARSRREKQHSK